MVVMVSIIFAVCWLTDAVIFLLSYYSSSNSPSDITYAIAAVMILFNSAVNPFVYALVNQRFMEKIKAMLCCPSFSTNRIQPAREADGNASAGSTTLPTHMAETYS